MVCLVGLIGGSRMENFLFRMKVDVQAAGF
jgi:hypothetical protein